MTNGPEEPVYEDSGEDEPEVTVRFVSYSELRQPTMLEIAELISLNGAMLFSASTAAAIADDIMAGEQDIINSAIVARLAAARVSDWWEQLLVSEGTERVDTDSE